MNASYNICKIIRSVLKDWNDEGSVPSYRGKMQRLTNNYNALGCWGYEEICNRVVIELILKVEKSNEIIKLNFQTILNKNLRELSLTVNYAWKLQVATKVSGTTATTSATTVMIASQPALQQGQVVQLPISELWT